MKITVPVNHNFYEESPILDLNLGGAFGVKKSEEKKLFKEFFSSVYELKLEEKKFEKIKILNFKRRRVLESDEARLIIKLYSKQKNDQNKDCYIQTGLYAGVLFFKGCQINITTKYGGAFLKRMLNFVNDVYIDNEQEKAEKDKTENMFLFVVAYLFIQSLERAAVLGLPQQYKKHQERSHKVRGGIDFKEFLKKDIPFQGKLTSNFKERMFVQEIVDVLFLSLRKLEGIFGKEIHSRLLGLNQLLKQNYSGKFVNSATMHAAKTHQAINNPIYSEFKKVLEYAEIILFEKDLTPDSDKKSLSTTGYLFDISELYELYLEKLLSRHFPEWSVSGQEELHIYKKMFYRRSIFPDLVMRNRANGKIVVFDAKFKKMRMVNGDIDREDLHQIHSYSGYYGSELIASGLIFPLSIDTDILKAHSTSIYGNDSNEINFIIDGVFVSESHTMKDLIENEKAFIARISQIIGQ